MSSSEIQELEAQLAQLKQVQANTPREGAEDPAMTPRGGGANAVRALRKVGGDVADGAPSSVVVEQQPPSSSVETATDASSASEQENDDFDLQLYADNGFFPAYVAKPSAAGSTTATTNEASVESETDKAMQVDAPPNWIAKKTPGKFGKVFWSNTVTGETHYNELPPSPELLAEWAATAEIKREKGEEEFKRKQQALIDEAEEVEKQWKLQFEKDRVEKQRVEQERLTAQAAAAAEIPAWKRRLLERKQKKEGAKFSEEELAMLAIINQSKPAAAASVADVAGKPANATGTTGAATESFTEGNDAEDSKENNAANPKSPTSPSPAPMKMGQQGIVGAVATSDAATDESVAAASVASIVTYSSSTTVPAATPLVEKVIVKPAPLSDFEKLFMAKKKKFFSK